MREVKVEIPKNARFTRSMNAGMACDFENWRRAEEGKQIDEIVSELLEQTKNVNYTDGAVYAANMIFTPENKNTEGVKWRIFREYCAKKIAECQG